MSKEKYSLIKWKGTAKQLRRLLYLAELNSRANITIKELEAKRPAGK